MIILIINHQSTQKPIINLIRAIINQIAVKKLNQSIFSQCTPTRIAQTDLYNRIYQITQEYDFSPIKAQKITNELIQFFIKTIKIIAQDLIETIQTNALKNWLEDPELIEWLHQKWNVDGEEQLIKKYLKQLQLLLLSNLPQNQIIVVNFSVTPVLIGFNTDKLQLWTKQTEKIGNATLHNIVYWPKSLSHFYNL
ncbi:hypothetical protein [Chroococcus sp. FPU101]|uniref:hypothetical protein n=1 Tax=Chroococcus sp. FPU101 TaxID=1974212 RepID=UPI001A8D0B53|nr:hypothetical protein [Chroococcus sp. FPU101]GFE69031.1 hypothetical protein CFPU101_16410 [Chroococcus sp. FPU101]